MEHTKASSLIDMANGAIKERLDYEMGRVIQEHQRPEHQGYRQAHHYGEDHLGAGRGAPAR